MKDQELKKLEQAFPMAFPSPKTEEEQADLEAYAEHISRKYRDSGLLDSE